MPLRLAELGTVYRAELAGTLHGLLRLRGFTQDDAHVFCTPDTVRDEILACLDFAFDVYRVFGFERYHVDLSVRGSDSGKQYLGADADWQHAEDGLIRPCPGGRSRSWHRASSAPARATKPTSSGSLSIRFGLRKDSALPGPR